jgi:phage terminase small subunit
MVNANAKARVIIALNDSEDMPPMNGGRNPGNAGRQPGGIQMAKGLSDRQRIRREIAEKHARRIEELEISADRVLQDLAKIAFFDPGKLFNDDGCLIDITELDDETAAAIARFEVFELFDGSKGDQKHVTGLVKKITLADKLEALELLGKYLKLWTDKVEHSGKLTLESLVCGGGSDD